MDETLGLPLRAVQSELSDGKVHVFLEHVSTEPSVAVVVRHNEHLLLIKVRRPVTGGEPSWEIPRGFSDGERSLDAGRREVREEVGLEVDEIRQIGLFYADNGAIAQPTAVLEATVKDMAVTLQRDESIEDSQWVTLDRVHAMIRAGEIQDGFTITSIAYLDPRVVDPHSDTRAGNPLRLFFLQDTAENMRATETKQVQLAAGVAAATAALVAVVFSESTSFITSTPRRVVGLVAILLWSLASSTKMLRYRSWKEHYADRLKSLVGSDYTGLAPVIYRPSEPSKGRAVTLARRLWRDESLTGVSVVVVVSSMSILIFMFLRWITENHGTPVTVLASASATVFAAVVISVLLAAARPVR